MCDYTFVGVDVAKDTFDMAFCKKNKSIHQQFISDKKGYKSFIVYLQRNVDNPWVCMEATGHYSEMLADYLVAHGVRVSIINPLQIKNFTRAKLTRNKNDKLDAKMIAQYGEMMRPHIFQSRSETQKELKDLLKLLDTLKEQLVQLNNQLHSTQGKTAKQLLKKLIKDLEDKIASLEKTLDTIVAKEEALQQKVNILLTIKGVGKLTAYKILAQTPNIEIYQRAKQFAATLGVTPKQNQSGKFQGKTTISRMGDARIRKALYMAALVAKRYNPPLKAFAETLKQRGKAPKAIICAVMRKLAHIIFGVLKHNQPFNPDLA